jgi:hypothetical protein
MGDGGHAIVLVAARQRAIEASSMGMACDWIRATTRIRIARLLISVRFRVLERLLRRFCAAFLAPAETDNAPCEESRSAAV